VVDSAETMNGYRTIDHAEAQRLIASREVTVLDVRTPGEYAQLGHIPDAWLIPVDLAASAPAVLPEDRKPVLVYCEHGVRSVAASQLLAAAGFEEVLNLAGGLAAWSGPREFGAGQLRGPSPWLIDNADLLPRGGKVLDVACGRGRPALLMASAGFDVHAIDRDPEAIAFLRDTAARLNLTLAAEVVDLETDPPPDLPAAYDLVPRNRSAAGSARRIRPRPDVQLSPSSADAGAAQCAEARGADLLRDVHDAPG
jgi:rhodanese-related sulfurtransferase